MTTVAFDKSAEAFPVRERYVFLSSCAFSPMHALALERLVELAEAQARSGILVFARYEETLDRLRAAAAELLGTVPDNVSFHGNSSEAISMIAAGYPFRPRDRVVTYTHEYPANHYPWRNLERLGVEVVQLENVCPPGQEECGKRPCAFSIEQLAAQLTDRTRVVALSHVQFASGFALDVETVAALCRGRGVDLVLDAAQSLGALPLDPDAHGIAAVVGSGWKWLLGPVGAALMYTSPEIRAKLGHVLLGAESMKQGTDYLDHAWAPHETARRFQYGTSPLALAGALEASISAVHLRYGVAALRDEILRLQDLLLDVLDQDSFTPVLFDSANRSGILAVICRRRPAETVSAAMQEHGFVTTARGGYLRVAPHFYVTDDEIVRFGETLNRLGS
jgi:selenocysteine lyase/cysteine desulfurase